MTIETPTGRVEADPSNAILLAYPNDLLDGFFVDMDDQYMFVSAHSEGFQDLKEQVISEGIPIGDVGENADLAEYPHCYVVESLGHFIVEAAEEATRGTE